MKRHLDNIAASLGLVLGVAAMAGMVASGAYANAAGAEARAYQALFQPVSDAACQVAANEVDPNEVAQ
jgi:hypothetical protein